MSLPFSSKIPDELLITIFELVDPVKLVQCRQVRLAPC
jgi:hypothetical protein